MVVEVAVIKDVCSSCSIKSVSSCFSKRSSGLVVVKVTGLLEKVSSCSRSSRSGRSKSSILRTKSVAKKEMNECMAEIYDPGGIQTRAAGLISQYHNYWAKENSP